MDASQLIALRRQREIAAANMLAANVPYGQILRAGGGAATGGDIMGGNMQFFTRRGQIDPVVVPAAPVRSGILPGPAPEKPVPVPEPEVPVQDVVLQVFEDVLTWIQTNKKGPTEAARLIYLCSFAAAAAWSVAQNPEMPGLLTGIHDDWDWGWHKNTGISTGNWLCRSFLPVISSFLPGFSSPLAKPVDADWQARWSTWIASRQADGSAALPVPTVTDLSNINLEIDVSAGGLPVGIIANQWTPLKIGSKKQSYLTFNWRQVKSTCLSAADETNIFAAAAVAFPTGLVRSSEVQDVINYTANLTDQQKMIAEFWAGGPGTATPPGMLAWFWVEHCRASTHSERVLLLSGLDLGIHLFEGSRLTWGLKAKYVQARPIQEIRARFAGQQMTKWDGTQITGSQWTPYQETDFVSPPFADFPSGHSCFSAVFAEVMKMWFGSTVVSLPGRRLDLISSGLHSIGSSIVALAHSSKIQPGVVPAAPISFSWATWDELATEAGMSRLYGGIHCISAHSGSQRSALAAHSHIEAAWGFVASA